MEFCQQSRFDRGIECIGLVLQNLQPGGDDCFLVNFGSAPVPLSEEDVGEEIRTKLSSSVAQTDLLPVVSDALCAVTMLGNRESHAEPHAGFAPPALMLKVGRRQVIADEGRLADVGAYYVGGQSIPRLRIEPRQRQRSVGKRTFVVGVAKASIWRGRFGG